MYSQRGVHAGDSVSHKEVELQADGVCTFFRKIGIVAGLNDILAGYFNNHLSVSPA